MSRRSTGRLAALLILSCLSITTANASIHDYAVEVSTKIHQSPPQIDFVWPVDATAEQIWVFKKAMADTTWGEPLALLDGSATTFTDADVAIGEAYEYSFQKNLGVIRDTLNVSDGTAVTFTIRDTWGDGICCHHGLGAYAVTGCRTVYASGDAFDAAEVTSFVTGGAETCGEVVVTIVLDLYGQETNWTLTDDATGDPLGSGGPYEAPRFGHILAGIHAPAVHDRGSILIIAEDGVAFDLSGSLERLELDLIGDGYRVHRRTVAIDDEVIAVKDLILAEAAADESISTLLLFGHVPVPYSGDVWSAHTNHCGAWPADLYYAELDGEWTDEWVTNETGSRPENHNVPGDGKFDQTWLPSDVDLQIGRVDLSRLPAFDESETELLQRYLDKDHAFRTGQVDAEERGLIDDNIGEAYGMAPAATGWRNFATMFGADQIDEGDFFPDLETESYLWAYGVGGSFYDICGGVGSTSQFANLPVYAVFTGMFGSYFGDWDNQDNVLRAPLGAEGYPLVCSWSGRPVWHLHYMALGHPIGVSTRLTQNNATLHRPSDGNRVIHCALMGDPTLRLHAVRPVSDLQVVPDGAQAIRISWSPSADAVEGYHVYRASTLHGVFARLTGDVMGDTTYVDADPLPENNVYMVRTLAIQSTASGTYENLSCGVIDSLSVTGVEGEAIADLRLLIQPSPVTGAATVRFCLPAAASVDLTIHDVRGGVVCRLERGALAAGPHARSWQATDRAGREVAGGIYFVRLVIGKNVISRKVTVLR